MTQRFNYSKLSPGMVKAMMALGNEIRNGSIEETILILVDMRASQMNGCAFCIDMHAKEAIIHGERPLRLSFLFSPRERAALAWTEALTKLADGGVPDEVYDRVRGELSEQEISDLTFRIMAINAWNRISVAARAVPGSADKVYGLDKAGL
ncbi:alkylhydroperoxidase AhpD family core domain protein [compost metagenome]